MNARNPSIALFAATILLSACSSNDHGPPDTPAPMVNQPPAISTITDRMVDQDTVVGPIEIGLTDAESVASQLTLTAAVDSTAPFPADGVALSGGGAVRTLTLTPLEAATGTALVTLTVTDPQGAASTRAFTVAVNARAASLRDVTLATLNKGVADEVTTLNGFTFTQDVDDPAVFDPLFGEP